jgi:mono/diheme cytochrome c family protein
MAASDQFYRNQRTLDIVFAASCVLMLVSIVWMFAQDYYRPYKTEQRVFRDVEVAMNQHLAAHALPDVDEILALEAEVEQAKKQRREDDAQAMELQDKINQYQPEREKAEARFQDIKAQHDSKVSLYDIAVEQQGPGSDKAKGYKNQIIELKKQLTAAQAERDNWVAKLLQTQKQRDAIDRPLTEAMTRLKKGYEKFDTLVIAAQKNEWTIYDTIRSAPVLDAFQPSVKIHQFTINDVPIDYNFKYATRFDRCLTCHQGIDKPAFTKENLASLRIPGPHDKKGQQKLAELQTKLAKARQLLEKRKKVLEGTPDAKRLPDPNSLVLTYLSKDYLTDARISEFAAHPRLDLFVGSNSKHPAERFGCSACHSGQGSATDFYNASHSPNDAEQAKKWKHEHDWASNHFWDFPMLPSRFVESSCLKCHHEVTDLISSDNKNEAPKLLRGYNLVRELGCFGCHEIAGIKNGKRVGPDMRLEPTPPLDKMLPEDRVKLLADPDNPPGTLSKVGPSLYRVADKTNKEWAVKWLSSPRSFRPDTKMPHFYNLSNNSPDVLPKEMQALPAAEMHAIAHFLFQSSKDYAATVEKLHAEDSAEGRKRDADLLMAMTTQVNLPDLIKQTTMLEAYQSLKDAPADKRPAMVEKLLSQETNQAKKEKLKKAVEMVNFVISLKESAGLSKKEMTQLELDPRGFLQDVKNRIAWRQAPGALTELLPAAEADKADPVNGRKLFSEKGCLACHHHDATMKTDNKKKIPALPSEQHFGPDLSQVRAKLGTTPDDKKSARLWLSNWIKNPQGHSPRSTMPKVPLTDKEILDITAWILDQPADKAVGSDWEYNRVNVSDDNQFFRLADVYLVRLLAQSDMDKLHLLHDSTSKKLESPAVRDLPEDEKKLVSDYTLDNVKHYLGKKAVGRLGCFACHDIPGFDDTKSIGVGLNDWGKKDPSRLAFEDIEAYVHDHYYEIDKTIKQGGQPHPTKFDVILTNFGEEKDRVITVVSEITGLGLTEAENLVGAAPTPVKKNVSKKDAEKFKKQLEEVRAEVTIVAVKKPYEKFFKDSLFHHDRIGYLNQKLLEPRSYDFNRERTWDDLSRMPQFKFARPGRKPGEEIEDYEARAWKEEAEAREAVMTFILGLVAEPVPTQSINKPKGDRLAEIKGRKVLEKFNCAGCHLIQPGAYEFNVSPEAHGLLKKSFGDVEGDRAKDYDFLNNHLWSGKTPKSGQDKLTAYGVPVFVPGGKLLLNKQGVLFLRLAYALRFEEQNGVLHDLRGKDQVQIPVQNLIYPPAEAFKPLQDILTDWDMAKEEGRIEDQKAHAARFKELYQGFEKHYGSYGGTFSNLLANYLATAGELGALSKAIYGGVDTSSTPYAPNPTNRAFAAGPPPLYLEGEKAQPNWIYQFLLKPQPIRKFVMLRMPHFNLSEDEAQQLAQYFGAASRLANPKGDVSKSFVKVPQQAADFDDAYWKKKTHDYVKRLKATKVDKKTFYDERIEQLTPVWQKIEQDAKNDLDKAEKQLETIGKQLKNQKDNADFQEAERVWKNEVDRLKALVKDTNPKKLRQQWEDTEAYVTDAFRLLGSKDHCAKCHQIGNLMTPSTNPDDVQGPPLILAQKRLQPSWVKHWVANPYRHLPYESPMIQYFERNKKDDKAWKLFPGEPLEQVQALTDVLMIYDRAIDMPITRHWTLLPMIQAKKE